MKTYLEYLVYCIPLVFIVLSIMCRLKLKKLKYSGKVPALIGIRERETIFFVLAILSTLVLVITSFQLFSQSTY